MTMSVSTFASSANSTSDRYNMIPLQKTLNTDGYQSKVVEQSCITLQKAMKLALENTDEQARNKEMSKALTRNLRSVRGALDYTQYKKYVQILNATLNNYDIEVR